MTTAETTTGRELDPAAQATWVKLRDVQSQIVDLTVQAETYKAQLREHLGAGAYTVAGRPAFTITPQRKFDPDIAATVLTPDELARCSKVVLDRELVEQALSAERYDACKSEKGKATVRPA